MNWNAAKAVEHLILHAQSSSKGRCAQYTREAIESGGVTLTRHGSAKDYGTSLVSVGFAALNFCPVRFQLGDVVIIHAFAGHPHGHMAMYDGQRWISDFAQRDLYPGPAYRSSKPDYVIYRHPDAEGVVAMCT